MTPVNASGSIDFVSGMIQLAKDLQFLTLDTESIILFEFPHTSVGEALLDSSGGTLRVDNLGSSGCDGVSIDLGESDSFDSAWQVIDPAGTSPPGSFVTAEAEGLLGGLPDQPLGSCTVTKLGVSPALFEVTADFSTFAGPTQLVEVYDAGTLVVSFPAQSSPLATSTNWPCGFGKLGGQTECFTSKYPVGNSFMIGGSAFVGDELRVLAEGSTSSVAYKSLFRIRAADLPEIVLTAESQVDAIGASERARFGTPANPGTLQSGGLPILGTLWTPSIAGVPSLLDVLLLDPLGSMINVPIPYGTLLCGFPAPNFQFFGLPGQPFAIGIPLDVSLNGLAVCAQGAGITFGPLDLQMTNALDLVLGEF